jgi:hypothetical protein
MKKVAVILGCGLVLGLVALIARSKPGDYHLCEFESIKTNFNSYRPSLFDRLKGIRSNQAKWDYHLRRLRELGVVDHTNFVFTSVPFTHESSRRVFQAACSNFPTAVMLSATYYAITDPAYGVRPYALQVWDFPSNSQRWVSFFQANNR